MRATEQQQPGATRVPSYDDLTPGIPDVLDSENVTQLALFLRKETTESKERPPSIPSIPSSPSIPSHLYACLRQVSCGPGRTLLAVARDFSPRVMRVSDAEVLVDVSGLGRLIGEPPAIAAEIARALRAAGVEGHVAIAPTQTAARLLAVPARADAAPRLSEVPVASLQPLEALPPAMPLRDRLRPYETLERWGIATLGDLAALPAAALSARLGRRGVALQRLARGLDPHPFVPDGETPRYIGRLELEWPLDALEPLSFVIARLLEPLAAALERADRAAAAIRLDLRLTDRSTHPRVLQLPAPMRDARVLRTLLLLDLESHPPSAAIDVVAIELDPAPARITQFSLLRRALPSPETLSTLTARLSALVGESRIGSPVLEDSHRADAFRMTAYAPEKGADGANGANGANGAGADGANGANGAGANGAGANGANGAAVNGANAPGSAVAEGARGACDLVLRRQRVPPAIRVRVERGRPVYIAATRGLHGAVTQAAGPWRTSGGWWTLPPDRRAWSSACGPGEAADRRAWNNDEWDVSLATGAVCRIFQDRATAHWFLEGIYD